MAQADWLLGGPKKSALPSRAAVRGYGPVSSYA